jgi:UDP-N-acetylmuramate-alanine ligase
VFDDLGKHPEALAANLRALRDLCPRRVHVIYEASLHADVLRWRRRWIDILGQADSAFVLPMNYRASLAVARRAPVDWMHHDGSTAERVDSRDEAVDRVVQRCDNNDIVLVCGMADDLAVVARAVLARLDA